MVCRALNKPLERLFAMIPFIRNNRRDKAMHHVTEKSTCLRCGNEVYRRAIHIENLSNYDLSSKQAYIKSLMKYESVSEEVATSWAEHGLYELCEEKIRHCPSCQHQLKTWRAKLCLNCGAQFESWYKE